MTLQQDIATALGVRPEIDPVAEIDRRVGFLADYLRYTGAQGYVLGISGGQDSTLAGRLAQLAVERVRAEGGEAVFIAVRLPYRVQHDAEDASAAMAFLRADESVEINIEHSVDGLEADLEAAGLGEVTDFNRGNIKARMRMVTQYAIAGHRGMLVIGTDHAAEAVTGFFTKFGDGACDVTPLAGLSKRQGRALLLHLEAPYALAHKIPTADLLDAIPGRTDEDELGLTYEQIDDFLEGRAVPAEVAEQLGARYLATSHKRRQPVTPDDTWWR
ncbi:ammonia-dependent NAD(+) synthetase [Microbacterium capsulatum]|uniref:NH(3)-dependent NAD(+) synthetase n=1 Tax=Microbacterium capsulatum TaxID=3041921 RepID=A0ABU0XK73_9MICO|nr:ammonia-dependent NAD(+) synthetase [Microbacterium sp. ASV81]MDQ4215544.1 ammonia-dependent NAD(+) synthetase [Microbacterium sp. ASV81]